MTTTFAYEALTAEGVMTKGVLESESADRAAQQLTKQRMVPLSVKANNAGLNRDITIPSLNGRTGLSDLAVMTRQFASMTASGLSLIRALTILEDQATKPGLKEALRQVRLDVQGGSTLSSAMAKQDEHFPPLMVDMLKAGELGGFLDEALARIASMYEADSALRATIKSALTYPALVLLFSILMGTGVIIFIVPIFEHMFANLGGKLPLPTRILVTLSHNMLWIVPLVVVGGVVGERSYRRGVRRNAAFRLRTDRLKLRLPVFGTLLSKIAISRWARNLGTLMSVGVPLLQALDIVGGTSGNSVVSEAMEDVKSSVREGQQISGPLAKHVLFPSMVVQMVEVGEETGQIVQMLDKVSEYYDHEVKTATESLTSALEPLMVVLMGAVIGTMVICLYLPMFTIYQHIQG